MNELRECYRLLETAPESSPEELKRAYRDLVKVWHPDRFADDPRLQARAQEKLKQINQAYEAICEPRIVQPPPVADPPRATAARSQASGWNGTPPEAAPPPPPRKRVWGPALVAAVPLFIVFQIAMLVVIASVIGAVLGINP
jgi:hypothetical protein